MLTYHHEKTKTVAAQSHADVHVLSSAVDGAALVEQILDGDIARQDDQDLCAQDEAVDGPVLLSPLLELQVSISSRHLWKAASATVCAQSHRILVFT